MSHSLYSYLCRQPTQKLQDILQQYDAAEQDDLNDAIIRMITEILADRLCPNDCP